MPKKEFNIDDFKGGSGLADDGEAFLMAVEKEQIDPILAPLFYRVGIAKSMTRKEIIDVFEGLLSENSRHINDLARDQVEKMKGSYASLEARKSLEALGMDSFQLEKMFSSHYEIAKVYFRNKVSELVGQLKSTLPKS